LALHEIELESDDGPVGEGGSGAHWVTARDGSKWIAKATYFGGQPHRYLYLNEALAKLIAARLGVRIPRAAALRLTVEQAQALSAGRMPDDQVIFACERVDQAEALSPQAVRGSDPGERAGIVVLDALIWNTDNKPEHVLAQPQNGGWQLWPVDHGHTLAVADALDALQNVDAPYAAFPLLNEDLTRSDLDPWIERVRGFAQEDFAEMIRTLPQQWVVEPDAPERLAESLYNRAQRLEQVLYQHFQ
jgi:hypothetical protein